MTIDTKRSRAVMAKRTPGEWVVEIRRLPPPGNLVLAGIRAPGRSRVNIEMEEHDAEAICHAVNIHDALCDEIDALRKQRRLMAEYIALDATDSFWRAEAERMLEEP